MINVKNAICSMALASTAYATSASAAVITRTFYFVATDLFTNANPLAPPPAIASFSGSFKISFDPALNYLGSNNHFGTLNSLSLGYGGPLNFFYLAGSGNLSSQMYVGLNGAGNSVANTNDFSIFINGAETNAPDLFLATYAASGDPNFYAGVQGTITFSDAMAGVPEPASWAMLIAGFGLTGSAMRRTKRRITALQVSN